jgi:hypothetical protein
MAPNHVSNHISCHHFIQCVAVVPSRSIANHSSEKQTKTQSIHKPNSLNKMPITIPLLDSLLSPHPSDAEKHYQSIPLESRVVELTSVLVQHTPNNAAEDARSLLAATLLRRDLSTLSSCDAATGQISDPLMKLFEECSNERTKRMVGRCIAELCGGEWMMQVLKRLENGVST